MKRTLSSLFLLCVLVLSIAAQPQRPEQREDRRTKVIIDNDLCGDADGLFALAHQLLCKSVNIRGIVGAHLGPRGGFSNAANTAQASVEKANEIADALGMAGQFKIVPGAPKAMEAPDKPVVSEGSQLIVEEALACTPDKPLYVLVGGPLTDIASALRTKPEIAANIIVVWIGGQEYPFGHPQPCGGISEVEYNLNLSIPAARMIFNDSDVRLWQIPRDAYRQCLYGFDEIQLKLAPYGKIGEVLASSLERMQRFSQKEMYVLGDSPLVLVSSLQTFFEPDTASCDFEVTRAPCITESGSYDFNRPGREIRVYTHLDNALMFRDMETKIQLHSINNK